MSRFTFQQELPSAMQVMVFRCPVLTAISASRPSAGDVNLQGFFFVHFVGDLPRELAPLFLQKRAPVGSGLLLEPCRVRAWFQCRFRLHTGISWQLHLRSITTLLKLRFVTVAAKRLDVFSQTRLDLLSFRWSYTRGNEVTTRMRTMRSQTRTASSARGSLPQS